MPENRRCGTRKMSDYKAIEWSEGKLKLLDQTRLPNEYIVLDLESHQDAIDSIKEMRVRGAPAIGVVAAYAVAMAARDMQAPDMLSFMEGLEVEARRIADARPTAVNLAWAVERMMRLARAGNSVDETKKSLLTEALLMQEEDEETNRRMGMHGVELMPDGGTVLTHCNTGALATAGFGTALGVIRAGWEEGKRYGVIATETRPFLQGARLTAWELMQLNIPATLVVDSSAGLLMRQGEVDCVIVGADRIAANGDVANKIGTYSLAVLAKEHGIPFYVAAPTSTVDMSIASGDEIPIEERNPEEVTTLAGVRTAPEGIGVRNPAFDVTPHRYVSAIVTEKGIARDPYNEALLLMLKDRLGNGG